MLQAPEIPLDAQAVESLPQDVEQLLIEADITPVFQGVFYFLESKHREFFAEERSPDGTPWPPLSESTIRRKGHAIKLVETLDLIRSMTGGGLRSDGLSVREIVNEGPNKGFSFGTSRPEAWRHQDGVGVPQREFAGFTDEMLDEIDTRVGDWAVGVITGG